MSQSLLFTPFALGRITLSNRTVMAPMTRNRCPGNVPGEIVATYYAQRATAGLIISEGVAPSANGTGYARIPGLYSQAQVDGWRKVTDAVHAKGGHIFARLMHTGRASHQSNLPAGAMVVAPSALALPDPVFVDDHGPLPATVPVAMTDAQVEATVEEYVQAAENAIAAGFDGVELHGANGYLIEQFLSGSTNQRADRWGGTIENRIRFVVEIAKRTAAKIGADRVGLRLSPHGVFNGITPDADTPELYTAVATEMGKLGIAYLHVVDHSAIGAPPVAATTKAAIRKAFGGTYILSGGYTTAVGAESDLQSGLGELVAFGRPFLANPNLVEKLQSGAALNPPDFATFYTPGTVGYLDYPA